MIDFSRSRKARLEKLTLGSQFHIFQWLMLRKYESNKRAASYFMHRAWTDLRLGTCCMCLNPDKKQTSQVKATKLATWLSKSRKKSFLLLNWRLWLISSDRPWFQLDKAICRALETGKERKRNFSLWWRKWEEESERELEKGLLSSKLLSQSNFHLFSISRHAM